MATRKQHKQSKQSKQHKQSKQRKQSTRRRYGGNGKNSTRLNPSAAPFQPALNPSYNPSASMGYEFPSVVSPKQSARAEYNRRNPLGSLKPYNGNWKKSISASAPPAQ